MFKIEDLIDNGGYFKLFFVPEVDKDKKASGEAVEFQIMGTLYSYSGAMISIQAVCPAKEAEKAKEEAKKKLLEATANQKTKKEAQKEALNMTVAQMERLEDDLLDYLRKNRPDYDDTDFRNYVKENMTNEPLTKHDLVQKYYENGLQNDQRI